MKNKHGITGKFFYASLSAMLIGQLGLAQAASFSDVPATHPDYKAIEFLKQEGIISGYSDGTFKPSQVVNRAEALKMIFVAKKTVLKTYTTASFPDVPLNQWFAKFVETARELKIVGGNPDGTFAPARNVNKAEFLKMFLLAYEVKFVNYKLPDKSLYADLTDKTQWFVPYFDFAKNINIISPNSQDNIEPAKDLTRGEVAEIIYKFEVILKGGPVQLLLSRAEGQLLQSMFDLQANKLEDAALDVKTAKDLANQALQQSPDQSIVKAAVKIISAFESLIQAFKDSAAKNLDSALKNAGSAYNLADEARNINSGVENLATQVKNAAKSLADQIRAEQAK
jgi:methyl-accepting chemotaxis protein